MELLTVFGREILVAHSEEHNAFYKTYYRRNKSPNEKNVENPCHWLVQVKLMYPKTTDK